MICSNSRESFGRFFFFFAAWVGTFPGSHEIYSTCPSAKQTLWIIWSRVSWPTNAKLIFWILLYAFLSTQKKKKKNKYLVNATENLVICHSLPLLKGYKLFLICSLYKSSWGYSRCKRVFVPNLNLNPTFFKVTCLAWKKYQETAFQRGDFFL